MKNLRVCGTVVLTALFVSGVNAQTIRRGNEGAGGGNGTPVLPIHKDHLAAYFANLKRYSELIFNRHVWAELGCEPDDTECTQHPSERVEQKFRTYGIDASRALIRNMTLSIAVQGPCVDPHTGDERDAVAFISENRICLSVDRLALRNYSNQNIYDKLVPLFLHEIAHFVGATEEEAQAFQDRLEANVHIGDGSLLGNAAVQTYTHLFEIEKRIAYTGRQLSEDVGATCLGIGRLSELVTTGLVELDIILGESGVSFFTEPQFEQLYSVYALGYAMRGFCLSTNREKYERPFEGKDEIIDDNGVRIPLVEFGELTDVVYIVDTMKGITAQAIRDMDASQTPIKCKAEWEEDDEFDEDFLGLSCGSHHDQEKRDGSDSADKKRGDGHSDEGREDGNGGADKKREHDSTDVKRKKTTEAASKRKTLFKKF